MTSASRSYEFNSEADRSITLLFLNTLKLGILEARFP